MSAFTKSAAVAGLSVAAIVIATVPGIAITNASWNDSEWANASVGALDCDANSAFATRGAGQFLGGQPLSSVAAVEGIEVEKSGSDPSTSDPSVPPLAGPPANAYANPLVVSAVNDLLTIDLSGVLQLPLNTPVGVLNQYGQAQGDGYSAGASGLVNNSGAIDLTGYPDPADIPTVATLNLEDVVAEALGTANAALVSEVAELTLSLGAVSGVAELDACELEFTGALADALVRDYLIAGLDLDVESGLVGDLVSTISTAISGLTSVTAGLNTNPALLTGLTDLVDPLLGGLQLGTLNADLTATVDTSGLDALLTSTYSDSNGIVSIDLGSGVVGVDIAALLGGANGLNDLLPNTELLINSAVINTLQIALAEALGDLLDDVTTELTDAIASIEVSGDVDLTVEALGIEVITLGVDLTAAPLSALNSNTATVAQAAITLNVLGILDCDAIIPGALELLVCPILDEVTGNLTGGIQAVIGTAVADLYDGVVTTLTNSLTTLTTGVTAPLVVLLDALLSGLFGDDGIASVLINVQNDPLTGNAEPSDWASIPAGQYDVAAIRIGVLGLLAPIDLDVVLARASVGVNALVP